MSKHIQIIILVLVFGTKITISQINTKLLYSEYLNYSEIQAKARKAKENKEFRKAISLFNISAISIENTPSAYVNIAECYWHLQNKDSTWYYLKQAFIWGYDKSYLKYKKDIQGYFKDSIDQYYPIYSNLQVDTLLRNRLGKLHAADQRYRRQLRGATEREKDSLWALQLPIDQANTKSLKNIVNEYGWPGTKVIGKPPLSKRPMAHLLVAHMEEADKLYFQEVAIDAALRNETSWSDAELISQQLLFKHPDNGRIKLRRIFLTNDMQIDYERSLLQLNAIVKLFTTNKHSNIELFAAAYADRPAVQNHVKLLEDIRNYLIALGLSEERIMFKWKPTLVEHDPLGDYLFGFTKIRNR